VHLLCSICTLWSTITGGLIVATASYASAEPTISASITPRHGEEDDLFIFTVKVAGAERLNAKPKFLNDLDFDATLLGPQTSISIVNGVVDSRVSYVYQLTPKRTGILKTPRVELEHNGKTLVAPEIEVSVDPAGAKAQDPASDPSTTTSGPMSEKLFIKQSVAPQKVYQGQQVINSLSLYTRVELAEFNLEDFSTDGFWQERFIDNDRSTTQVKGHEFVRLEHAKALYPLASGKLSVPPRTARAKVVVRTQRQLPPLLDFGDSLLHDFFQSVQHKEVKLSSEALHIDVEPLPPPPTELAGLLGSIPLVGETTLRASYSSDPISAGEVKTVAIELTTTGNVHPIKSITLSPPSGVKIYEENPETTSTRSGSHVTMKRVFRFSLVPLRGGIVTIPAARIAYFDPNRKQYLTASTSEITFAVNGPTSNSGPRVSGLRGAENGASNSAVQGSPDALPTLPPVPVAPDLEYREPSTLQKLTEVVSVQLALLIAAATVALSTLVVLLSRRFGRIQKATVTPAVLDRAKNSAELERLLRRFICEKIPTARVDDTYELLRARVRASAPSVELAQATCALIDQIEAARYGADSQSDGVAEQRLRMKEIMKHW
jgi:hypothetical protein